MFTDLNNVLAAGSVMPQLIGIGEKFVDSSFLIHHFISFYLKHDMNVVLISFSQAFNHFNGVGTKIGSNLSKAKEVSTFCFIDGLRNLGQCLNAGPPAGESPWSKCVVNGVIDTTLLLNALITEIKDFTKAADTSKKTAVIIDNISSLIDTGIKPKDVIKLLHYMKVFIREDFNGSLVTGCISDETDEDHVIVSNFMQHTVDLFLLAKGLETGYCKDVHGQVGHFMYNVAYGHLFTRGFCRRRTFVC